MKRNKEININLCTDNKDWQTKHTYIYYFNINKQNMCNFIKFSFYLDVVKSLSKLVETEFKDMNTLFCIF